MHHTSFSLVFFLPLFMNNDERWFSRTPFHAWARFVPVKRWDFTVISVLKSSAVMCAAVSNRKILLLSHACAWLTASSSFAKPAWASIFPRQRDGRLRSRCQVIPRCSTGHTGRKQLHVLSQNLSQLRSAAKRLGVRWYRPNQRLALVPLPSPYSLWYLVRCLSLEWLSLFMSQLWLPDFKFKPMKSRKQ